MHTYESIEKGILENDLPLLREAICNICYVCPDFSDGVFYELVDYVISKGIQIYDSALNGSLISDGKNCFAEEDFSDAVYELKHNFCKERIENVKKIGIALYKKAPAEEPPVSEEAGVDPNANCHQTLSKKLKIAGLVVAGMAILALVITVVILLL